LEKYTFNRYIGAVQLGLLALIFALPWLSGGQIQPVSLKSLNILIAFEFGILIMGWLIAGFLFVPMALVDSPKVRMILLLLALLITWPLTAAYSREYGWQGAVSIYWLLFANYGSVFVHSMALYGRRRLLAEVGLRAIFYPILFMLVAGVFDMPTWVGRWPDRDETYLFGLVYFGVLAIFELKRYYQKSINFIFALISGKYQRLPRQKARTRAGRLKSHVIRFGRPHLWWLGLGVGGAVLALVSVFIHASLTMDESIFLKILVWVFCLPFFLIGLVLVLSGAWLANRYFTAKPPWLILEYDSDINAGKLHFEGFVPLYDRRETRESMEPVLKCYRLTFPPGEDEFASAETVFEMAAGPELIESASSRGTRFQFEIPYPDLNDVVFAENEKRVWHLQLNITDTLQDNETIIKVRALSADDDRGQWSMAFTLPL